MKVYEKIQQHRGLLVTFSRNGVGTAWTRYLEMYSDYSRLIREGHKKMYVEHYLAEIYALSTRTIRRVCKRLGEDFSE